MAPDPQPLSKAATTTALPPPLSGTSTKIEGALPNVAAPLSELGSTSERYKRELAKFRSAGIEVDPSPTVVIPDRDFRNISLELTTAGSRFGLEYRSTVHGLSALSVLENSRGQDRDLLPPLSRSVAPLKAPVYQLTSEGNPSGDGKIIIQDLVLGRNVVSIPASAFRLNYENRDSLDGVIPKAVEQLVAYDKANHDRHQQVIAALPIKPAVEIAIVSIYGTNNLPTGAIESLRAVLGRDQALTISSAANGQPVDIVSGIRFTGETIPNRPLLVRGPINQVSFSFEFDGSRAKETSNLGFETHGPAGQILKIDKVAIPGQKTIGHYHICPPLPLLKPGEDPNKVFEVPLSLGPLGRGQTISGAIFQTGLQPVSKIGNHLVYTSIETDLFKRVIEPRLGDIRSGMKKAELLLGVRSGQYCESIYIAPTAFEGAYYAAKDSRTIVIPPSSFEQPSQAKYSAFHETVHLLDRATGYKLSDSLKATFNSLDNGRGSFVEEINERNFLPGSHPLAGHAADNTAELLASVLNSTFNHPQWRDRVEQMTDKQVIDYKLVIDAIVGGAKKVDQKIADTAALYQKLEVKSAQLKEMLEERK